MDIFDPRTSPGIDRLIIVTNRSHTGVRARKQTNPCILNGIGILEFIDQYLPKTVAVVTENGGVVQPEFMGAQQ